MINNFKYFEGSNLVDAFSSRRILHEKFLVIHVHVNHQKKVTRGYASGTLISGPQWGHLFGWYLQCKIKENGLKNMVGYQDARSRPLQGDQLFGDNYPS